VLIRVNGNVDEGLARFLNSGIQLLDTLRFVALYTTWYNFARINSSVRMSPAMACGLEQRLWDIGDIVTLIDAAEMKAAA